MPVSIVRNNMFMTLTILGRSPAGEPGHHDVHRCHVSHAEQSASETSQYNRHDDGREQRPCSGTGLHQEHKATQHQRRYCVIGVSFDLQR